jgi:hypothetical protein
MLLLAGLLDGLSLMELGGELLTDPLAERLLDEFDGIAARRSDEALTAEELGRALHRRGQAQALASGPDGRHVPDLGLDADNVGHSVLLVAGDFWPRLPRSDARHESRI